MFSLSFLLRLPFSFFWNADLALSLRDLTVWITTFAYAYMPTLYHVWTILDMAWEVMAQYIFYGARVSQLLYKVQSGFLG